MEHMNYLEKVAAGDVEHIREKERTYGGSWKRRGGVGAFMMLARKWDRLDNILSAPKGGPTPQWDIFAHCAADMSGADGSVLAEVRDLRRYLLLVEAEMLAQQNQDGVSRAGSTMQDKNDPRVPRFGDSRPVPLEDSNKHADRGEVRGRTIIASRITPSDAKAFVMFEPGLLCPRPMISSDLYHALTPVARLQFRLCGKVAFPERRDWRGEDLEIAPKYPLTTSGVVLGGMPDWMSAMYEPRTGVEGEMQMKEEYRELWGK